MPMPNPTRLRSRPLHQVLLLGLLASVGTSFTQTASPVTEPATQFSIALLPPNQMATADRAIAEGWQQTIAASAQFYGYTLDSSYSYRQIACPVAPNHLVLAYEATAASGSISRFTAVVRRSAEEEIAGKHASAQIIPILHAGVVPFIRAIANPHSIEIFNAVFSPAPGPTEVLAAAQSGNQPLLVRALCYLAIVGEEPVALRSPSLEPATIHAPIPTLQFLDRGRIRQLISVQSSANDYQVWALTFSAGKLLSATRAEYPIVRTPLVLNANAATPPAPAPPAGAVSITPSTGVVSAAAAPAPMNAPPTPPVVRPMEPSAPSTPAASSINAESNTAPSPLQPPASETTITAEPATATVSSPSATVAQPAEPAQPIAPQPSTVTPSVANPPQPSAASATPASIAPGPTPPTPAAASVSLAPPIPATQTSPDIKPSAPVPPVRFIANPPTPPSRFIPGSSLKTPPHLPQ
jgi:hypothetical protein